MIPFRPYEIPGKPWGTERVVALTETYMGKILTMQAGHRGGLQLHRVKDEAFHLVSGRARVRGEDHIWRDMEAGETYHIPPLTVHQVEALEDCVFFEVGTPVFNDRVNCGDPAA